jgi:hypothetical protein
MQEAAGRLLGLPQAVHLTVWVIALYLFQLTKHDTHNAGIKLPRPQLRHGQASHERPAEIAVSLNDLLAGGTL